ncbi:class I SAM-dependent methyltransferase [Nocardioides sp. NPDC000445]|uniref:class I SAM-dependent methyltransferase n=1 Tax=Nocardioides sp. NPDC000445 TaxID=3154257 RepID=UPI00332763BF
MFGAMLTAAFEDRSVLEIVERDDGFLNRLSAARYFDPVSEWSAVDRWALDQCRGRVLDIGAGGGRAALELQRRGHDVVALDSSLGAINVCRKRGVQQTVHGNLERYANLAEFDTYLLFGNNLGLLESPTHGQAVLDAIASAARPDAIIVGTSTRPTATTNPVHLRYHESNIARGRLPGQLRLRSRYQDRVSDWFDYLLFEQEQLDEILQKANWRRLCTFEENENYATVITLDT